MLLHKMTTCLVSDITERLLQVHLIVIEGYF